MDCENERQPLLPEKALPVDAKINNYKLEPALLLVLFGWHLSSSIIPNQLLKQTCLFNGYNASNCDNLEHNKDATAKEIEEKIQPEVATILMVISMQNSIVTGILSLFFGTWSDKFGRKKIICATFFGHSLTLGSLSVISYFCVNNARISPWTYVIAYLPMIFSGGLSALLVSTLCYMADLSDETNRSFRFTIVEVIVCLGILLGMGSCSYVLKMTRPTSVFVISTLCASTAAIYTSIFVDESLKVRKDVPLCDQICEIFSIQPVIEMIKTCFKPREFGGRAILWCLIIIITFTFFLNNHTNDLFYLFVREKFQWTIRDATMYNSLSFLVNIFGAIFVLLILKRVFSFSDSTLAVIAIVSYMSDSFIKAIAESPIDLYIAIGTCMLKSLSIPMCRSLMASVVPRTDVGKVYSFTSTFEALFAMIAAPFYTFVYAKTFTVFTGAFYLISVGVCAINLMLMFKVISKKRVRDIILSRYGDLLSADKI